MSDPRVSVIVPVHNTERYLAECLDSILGQTEEDIEVICVDDGSTDSSPKILASYAGRDGRLRVITQECRGAGAARNRGLSTARGTYLSFLDADDFFEPDMLKSAADKLDDTGADIVVFGSWIFDNVQKNNRPAPWRFKVENLPAQDPFNYQDIPTYIFNSFGNVVWNKLFRRSFITLHNLQFQEISRCNDTFFSAASLVLARRITYVNQLFVHYRCSTNTSLQSTNDRDPRTLLTPYEGVYNLLISKHLYDSVSISFLNWVLDSTVNIIDSFKTMEGFLDCREAIISQLEPTYNLLSVSPELIETPENYDQYRCLCTAEPIEYLVQRVSHLRNKQSELYQLNDWRSQRTGELENEVATVRASASYRLGHALLIPARIVREIVRRLASHTTLNA